MTSAARRKTPPCKISTDELDAISLFVKAVAGEMPAIVQKPRKTRAGYLKMVAEFPDEVETWQVGTVLARSAAAVQAQTGIHISPE
jgi:hypothetical protein